MEDYNRAMRSSTSVHSYTSSGFTVYSRTEVIAAIQDLYTFLVKLPYISPDALVFPPPEGWPSVNAEELRHRGKTDEVLELLRHLPYLCAPARGKRWMLGPDTTEIAYCDGEVYSDVLDEILPVPGHCIWLTEPDSRDGTGLLLDTHAGTITEWANLGHRIIPEWEEYEKIPKPDKWMAHATIGVTAFFRRWKRKFERLIWMPMYNPKGREGTAQWYITVETRQDEEDMLASDDDFRPDTDGHKEVISGESETEDEDDMNKEDGQISDEEINDLMEDAYGEEASQKLVDMQAQEDAANHRPINSPPSEPINKYKPNMDFLNRQTKEVYEIYTENGWPSDFDRESCRVRLTKFIEREEGPLNWT